MTTRRAIPVWSGALLTSALLVAACGSSPAGTAAVPTTSAAGAPSSQPAGQAASQAASPGSDQAGKSLDNFDPCSVVSDADFVAAITAGAGDPSALGTIKATHAPVDGSNTGLPGAKACSQTWTTTDSAGRVNQGGEPVIVTFDVYSNLAEIQAGSPLINDYQASGAQAFIAPGDGAVPHLTKDGYLFRMSGNSDTALLKAIALGIAARL